MEPRYSRNRPSPRYAELLEQYRRMHAEGDARQGLAPEQTFPGHSLPRQAHRIRPLVALTGARALLDYGSGKGLQYRDVPVMQDGVARWGSIREYWGIETITCYDPGFEPHSTRPDGPFDGVICTDVLEHCPEDDLGWIVEDLFGFARRFVFANVACYPARKSLPNGENAHCTVRPVAYWDALFQAVSGRFPGIVWEVWADEDNRGISEKRLGNRDIVAGGKRPASGRSPVWRRV